MACLVAPWRRPTRPSLDGHVWVCSCLVLAGRHGWTTRTDACPTNIGLYGRNRPSSFGRLTSWFRGQIGRFTSRPPPSWPTQVSLFLVVQPWAMRSTVHGWTAHSCCGTLREVSAWWPVLWNTNPRHRWMCFSMRVTHWACCGGKQPRSSRSSSSLIWLGGCVCSTVGLTRKR